MAGGGGGFPGNQKTPLDTPLSSCRLQSYLVLRCGVPDRVAPVFVHVVSPPLRWSRLSSFLAIWYPRGDTRGPSVVIEAVDMLCPGPFHFSHNADYIYDVCPLPDSDVGLSILVYVTIRLYILVCSVASLFYASLISAQISAPYAIAHSTQEVYTCLFTQKAGSF